MERLLRRPELAGCPFGGIRFPIGRTRALYRASCAEIGTGGLQPFGKLMKEKKRCIGILPFLLDEYLGLLRTSDPSKLPNALHVFIVIEPRMRDV